MIDDALPPPAAVPAQNASCVKIETIDDVYREALADLPSRRFVRLLETADASKRQRALAASSTPVDPVTAVSVDTAIALAPCTASQADVAAARMDDAVSAVWNVADDREAERITTRLSTIARALQARDAVDPARVDALLAPFGTTVAALSAPVVDERTPCPVEHVYAKPVRITEPQMSAIAKVAEAVGTVKVEVTLDAEGDVERVSPYADAKGDTSSHALRTSTIQAAGSTTYAPELVNCRAAGGSYLFSATFRSR